MSMPILERSALASVIDNATLAPISGLHMVAEEAYSAGYRLQEDPPAPTETEQQTLALLFDIVAGFTKEDCDRAAAVVLAAGYRLVF